MSTTLTQTANRTGLPASLVVTVTEIAAAALLLAFLAAESTVMVVALLALMGAIFAGLQLWPQLEEVIVRAFHDARALATALALIIILIYPFFLGNNTYALHLLIVALIYSTLALALNFQLGSVNIPNFATGATYGIGAYTSALLAINFGWSFWATLPAAAITATVFGFLLGIPSMRTRDSYLALVTIAFGIVIQQLLNNLSWTGGANGLVGIPAPSLFGHSFMSPIEIAGRKLPPQANFYYLSAALLGLAILSAKRLHESRVGLAWNAIRADELAAKCQGINVVWYKILAFGVDAFLAAFAGTIYAFYISYISPDNFTFLVSVTIMTMVIVGGMDNTLGVILGAFLLTMLPEKLRVFSDYRLLFVSVVVILFLILRPKGLFPQRQRHYGEK
ncbi:branched-chain amino acid ABC transporter permease [Paracoccus aminophilus]|uniref:Branched-chain amino acid ABC-type transport system, permease component n=1 Tax=Paracoccus aminophilus JCM 7686 TaxID=1367847 RepID=S5YIP6_PARAH|nr:branched-chain amino acid ABC transporter permease [Paracoccus aminophilus]AGT11348.1 branched-chain amino acid ABC-type transport system, permease component [Paracoccus aminophilus JCM 7686]